MENKSKNKIFFFLIGIFLLLQIILVSADTGPHESATLYFNVTYNNSPIAGEFYANVFSCYESGCESDNSALCTDSVCEFSYYRIERVPRQMKLFVSINNENFTSDIINFSWINPVLFYDVNINAENKVAISPSPEQKESYNSSLLNSFALALALTIIIELAVLVIFLRKWGIKIRKWLKPVATLVIMNIISVPLVWLLYFLLIAMIAAIFPWASIVLSFVIAEALAVVFEAYAFFWINKKIITLKKAFMLSIIMNAASFVAGGIILATLMSGVLR